MGAFPSVLGLASKRILVVFETYSSISKRYGKRDYIMRRAPEISEFYGVEVSEFQIEALKGRKVRETEACRLNQDTAHLFAHAYQNGHQVPSGPRVEKTIKKNLAHFGRNEATVYRLDRAFKNYSYNPIAQTFKKKKKIDIHPAPAKPKKQKAFQVQSPEQIVIKCARQAYVRELLSQPAAAVVAKDQKKELSQSLKRRKAHQRERRNERTLIIKAYRDYLLDIFGNIVFSRGWRISREELKAELQLPIENLAVSYMAGIIRERQSLAAQRLIAYQGKKAAYLKEKRERLKVLKYLRAVKKNNYVPYEKRREFFDRKVVAEMKYTNGLRYKNAMEKGERTKFVRRRKMDKIKGYYRGTSTPSTKELEKQVLEATFDSDLQEETEELDLPVFLAKDEAETVAE